MEYTVNLPYNTNIKIAEEEEKCRFIKAILESLGIELEFWKDDVLPTIEDKIQLRSLMSKLDLSIIDDGDVVSIYTNSNKEEIGRWNKPIYKLIRDMSQLDPNKKLYLEMNISFSSKFE